MPFNKYILIDDNAGTALKFKTTHRTWKPAPEVPSTARQLLDGNLDVTFAASGLVRWQGEIAAPVTPEGAGWGSIADLRALLAKPQTFTFTDHYGALYAGAYFKGPFPQRSLMPDWTAADNVVYVQVTILAKAL
jgi:hypothetical protein